MAEMIDPDAMAAAPAAAPTLDPNAAPAPAAQPAAPELPDELIKIPALRALFAGTPPVALVKESFGKTKEGKLIKDHVKQLMNAGFGFYRALDGQTGAIFNAFHVAPEEIQAADQAGKLPEIAPPIEKLNAEVAKMGKKDHPSLKAKGVPNGPKIAPVPQVPTSSAMVKPPSAGAQKVMANQRAKLMTPMNPTQGPAAGQGALLRSILKPVA